MSKDRGSRDVRFFRLLDSLWAPDERRRLSAVQSLPPYGEAAVGPLTRRLFDWSPRVAQAALTALTALDYGEIPGYLQRCRSHPSEESLADLGACLSTIFEAEDRTRLQQAAIVAGLSRLTCYAPNLCHALARSEERFARRALAEACYHLADARLIQVYEALCSDGDETISTLAIHALVELGARAELTATLEAAEAASGLSPARLKLLGQVSGWLTGEIPPFRWADRHRWPEFVSNAMRPRQTEPLPLILEWAQEDLPEASLCRRDEAPERSAELSRLSRPDLAPPTGGRPRVHLWCDGSWTAVEQAGWGAVAEFDGEVVEWSGSLIVPRSTDAELRAAIQGVGHVAARLVEPTELVIHTDCSVIVEGMTYRARRWQASDWFNSAGVKVQGLPLWRELLALQATLQAEGHRLRWRWVKGHAGIAQNERADRLARQASGSCGVQQAIEPFTSLP